MASAATLLLVPLIAMLFTAEVKWTAFDFLIAEFLLFGTGLAIETVMMKFHNPAYRMIICAIIFILLFLVWAELAVGIFGSPIAGS